MISMCKNPGDLTMTLTAQLAAPVAATWQAWADPRLLEHWWGPPGFPATVLEHDLRRGGGVSYYMTGPDGDRYHGWWRITAVEAPCALEFEDGYAREDGTVDPEMPVSTVRVTLRDCSGEQAGHGTEMLIESAFQTLEAMEQMIAMGMEEGMSAAAGQIDGLLAGLRE